MLETLVTLGYNRQLLAARQLKGGGAGDTGNTGLQQATADNSGTHGRGCWRHWATTGNCWQLSNTQEGVLETLATLDYNRQLLTTQQHMGGGAGDIGLQQATAGN